MLGRNRLKPLEAVSKRLSVYLSILYAMLYSLICWIVSNNVYLIHWSGMFSIQYNIANYATCPLASFHIPYFNKIWWCDMISCNVMYCSEQKKYNITSCFWCEKRTHLAHTTHNSQQIMQSCTVRVRQQKCKAINYSNMLQIAPQNL